jgi:hypothetical protein
LSTTRILEYQLSCIGGLEDVAIDELQADLGGRIHALRVERGEVGRLFFRTEASPRRLLELGCPTAIEALAAQAHDVTVGQPGLLRVLRCLRTLPIDAVQRLARACDSDIDLSRVELRVTMSGAHRFAVKDVEHGAQPILQEAGLRTDRDASGTRPLRLTVRIRGKRVLATLQLGRRRPTGDPRREGWTGPAENSVRRLLDLDADLPVVSFPAPGVRSGFTVAASSMAGPGRFVAQSEQLPVASGSLPVLLSVPRLEHNNIAQQLQEAVRAVSPGGVLGLLVRRGEVLVSLLRSLGLPLEVMATVPFYLRRRRYALFLLERLELLGIEAV